MARHVDVVPPCWPRFHPLVKQWFKETSGNPSVRSARDGQRLRVERYARPQPDRTEKTLAAFLWELNELSSGAARSR